ncbi:hypothetical protein LTR66_017370, partial [Elasticomyces elasticus]
VLAKKNDVADDVVEYYVSLLREATTASATMTLAERSAAQAAGTTPGPFGNVVIHYGSDGSNPLSLEQAAAIEWAVVERLLRKVLVSRATLTFVGQQAGANAEQ